MENMINLSESDNINWKNIKKKMTNEMQSNVHKLLSRMPNKERILFNSSGFKPCQPFAHYKEDVNSLYLTKLLDNN